MALISGRDKTCVVSDVEVCVQNGHPKRMHMPPMHQMHSDLLQTQRKAA